METTQLEQIIENLTPVKVFEVRELGTNEEIDALFETFAHHIFDDILFRNFGEATSQFRLIEASKYLIPAIRVCSVGEERSVKSRTTPYGGKGADQRGVDPDTYLDNITLDYNEISPEDNVIE
ncbi:MAG: hypothetical protein QXM92_04050 [Candidatus Anstonellales archaeon]